MDFSRKQKIKSKRGMRGYNEGWEMVVSASGFTKEIYTSSAI